jgi:hypothetical protein
MRRHLPVAALLLAGCAKNGAVVDAGRLERLDPPVEVYAAVEATGVESRRIKGFTQAEPVGCSASPDVPTVEQFTIVLAALAADPALDGVVEVVLLADGCARLLEFREGGQVRRWELRRFVHVWTPVITWDFEPGVKRPSTIDRYALVEPLHRFGEWKGDELHRKRFVRPNGVYDYTHYRGEQALYAREPGREPQRISSNGSSPRCRTDGTNHCDDLEKKRWSRFNSGTDF